MILLDLLACLLVADFLSGVFHWMEDTYAVPGSVTWFNNDIVYPNILHHRFPKKIAEGSYLSHIQISFYLCAIGWLFLIVFQTQTWQPYATLLFLSHANYIHALSHTSEAELPQWVTLLQRTGLLLSQDHHAEHHRPNYTVRYCTMTNFGNPALDAVAFWRVLEAILPFEVKRVSAERGGY